MDNQIRMGGFNILPSGIKNLLIINVLVFFATFIFAKTGLCDLNKWLGLHFIGATDFHPWQFITYMFMHANFEHIFFNMFALWMFGAAVENIWGTKRFLLYYFITGIGAALVHYLVIFFQVQPTISLLDQFLNSPSLATFQNLVANSSGKFLNREALQETLTVLQNNPGFLNDLVVLVETSKVNILNSFNIVGASGAVYGILLVFGMLFPNSEIYFYFLIPIKAKWLVIIYGALELITGLTTTDGVAHFAHLGGMLFGLILILLWRKTDRENAFSYHEPRKSIFRNRERRKNKYYVSPESERPLTDEEYNARRAADNKRIDEILDKISASGYDSLTQEEKDFLFKHSQK